MRKLVIVSLGIAALVACGGSESAPEPVAEAPQKMEEAKPMEEAPAEEPAAAAEPVAAELSPEEAAKAQLELGKNVYETGGTGGVACQTCHMANGQGVPGAFPPLAGAGEAMGDCTTHAGYVIKGLTGEIEVLGQKYNGAMPAQGNLSDVEIAAVISYERTSWGNDYGACTAEQVAAAR